MSKKVLIFGLDGGTWAVFDPLIEEGYMPNLKRLKEDGVSGVLKSTIPPITPAAWTSFQTGMNPGKHGVFSFIQFDKDKKKFSFVNSDSIMVETVFEYLSRNGFKIISINLPVTYPPKHINGVMIGCFLTPSIKCDFIYPPHLKEMILKKFPNYTVSPVELVYKFNPFKSKRNFEKFLNGMLAQIKEKKELALYLMNNHEWDIFFVQFQSLDSFQHILWPYLDRTHPLFDNTKYKQLASSYFVELDTAIGEILECSAKTLKPGDEVLNIALSDHGFKKMRKAFNFQRWLIEKGYLVNTIKVGIKERLISYIVRLDKYNIRKGMRFFWALRAEKKELLNSYLKASIDFTKSKVFYSPIKGWGWLFLLSDQVNDKNEIIAELKNIYDEDREKVVKRIYHKEEIYNDGEGNKNLPDLVIEPADGYFFEAGGTDGRLFREIGINDKLIGDHDIDGMVIFNGKSILTGEKKIELNIWDIAPTLVYFLGLPIPKEMDGKVHKELFINKLENAEVKYINIPNKTDDKLSSEKRKEEEKEIENRLRKLGYM